MDLESIRELHLFINCSLTIKHTVVVENVRIVENKTRLSDRFTSLGSIFNNTKKKNSNYSFSF